MSGSSSVRVWSIVLSTLVAGAVGGVAWWMLADPATWEVRETGLALTEEASRGQFQVVVVFTLVGAIVALVWSVVLSLVLRGAGWSQVVVILLGSVVASLVAWQVGALLGHPAPETVGGLSLGDRVPDQLMIDSVAPFLAWPVAAMVGVLLATWGQARDGDYRRDTASTTAPVTTIRS
jgi:hypothetical protein